MEDPEEMEKNTWRSCCFFIDKRCLTFAIQSFIGIALLAFCSVRLATEPDCDRAAPYWGLIGTLCGFFFRKMPGNKINNVKDNNNNRRQSHANTSSIEMRGPATRV